MRISLIDVDSTIPNLALMKLSAYHKKKGDVVGFKLSNPNKIYASIVFTKNNWYSRNKLLFDVDIEFGGSGFEYSVKLPDEIEFIKPDYDLYPSTYSQGFTTRGCNRNCYFCIVPKKEGLFKIHQHPEEFHDDRFNEVKLMDNSILWNTAWTQEVLYYFIDQGVDVDMTQGYDVRLIDEHVIDPIIRSTKGMIRIAFDDMKDYEAVHKGINLFKDYGFDIRHRLQVYCYCHNSEMHDDCHKRCKMVKDLGTNAFVMFNCDMPKTRKIKNLIHWCNRKPLYWSIPYEKYSKICHT